MAVQNGTLPHQKTVRTTLGQLGQVAISNPAVMVVGAVAALDLNWFESKPLFGRTVVVTRARTQASTLSASLRDLGATVLEVPTLTFSEPDSWVPVDASIGILGTYDWLVFTSANGVDRFFDRLRHVGGDLRALHGVKIATIGSATSEKIHAYQLGVDLEADVRVSEGLVSAFARLGDVSGKRVLMVKPEIARDILPKGLRHLGALIDEVVVYRTTTPAGVPVAFLEAIDAHHVDLVTFASSSTVRNLVALLDEDHLARLKSQVNVACIGPITAETAKAQGFQVVVQCAEGDVSIEDMVNAIEGYFGNLLLNR